jgi:hypothetical protein
VGDLKDAGGSSNLPREKVDGGRHERKDVSRAALTAHSKMRLRSCLAPAQNIKTASSNYSN